MDTSIFTFFFDLSRYPWIGEFALFLSYPFAYAVVFLVVVWALVFNHKKTFTAFFLFSSGIVSWLLAYGIKDICKIPRPYVALTLTPLYSEAGYSFPSAHAAVFAALAAAMLFIDKRLGIILSIVAFLIGLSRMVIGVHYPIDVLGGFVLGVSVSLILKRAFKKI